MPPYSPLVISYSDDEEEPQFLSLVDINNNKTTNNSVVVVDLERIFQIEQIIPVKKTSTLSSSPSSSLPNLPKQNLPTIPERHVWLQEESFHPLTTSATTTATSSSSSSLKRNRRVSFAPIVEESNITIDYIHISEYTPAEIESTWYNKEDYFHMRKEIREIIRWNQLSKMRGLEFYSEAGMHTLHIIRHNAMYPVFAEQERQRRFLHNKKDPMIIAKFSINMTYYSQLKAIEIAKQDEKVVQEYLSEETTNSSSNSRSNQIVEKFFKSIIQNLFVQKKEDTTTTTTDAVKDHPFQNCQFLFDPSRFLPISSSTIISGPLLIQD